MNLPNNDNGFWSGRRWLARLSFSFLIIAAFLAYSGYKGAHDHSLSQGRVVLDYLCAMLAFVLFLAGVRARHRPGD